MKVKRKVSDDGKKLQALNKKKYESETSESDIPPAAPKSLQAKLSNFKTRTISSLIMVGGFALILSAGHFYCCLLVLLINICIFKEIVSLKRNSQREAKLPYFYIINWYFFGVTEVLVTLMFISHKMIMIPTLNVKAS
jgi:phosphatidate cytidylyltransferase